MARIDCPSDLALDTRQDEPVDDHSVSGRPFAVARIFLVVRDELLGSVAPVTHAPPAA